MITFLLSLAAPAITATEVRYIELEDCHWSLTQEGARYYKVSKVSSKKPIKAVEDVFTEKVYFVIAQADVVGSDALYYDRYACRLAGS